MCSIFKRATRLHCVALASAGLVLAACGVAERPNCLHLVKRSRFNISIEDLDSTECSDHLGLAPGVRLRATVRGFTPPGGRVECSPAFVELEAIDDPDGRWTPKDPSNVDHYGGFYVFRRAECRSIVLLNGRGAPMGTLGISSFPEETDGAAACSEPCKATANVRLTPL